MKISAVCSLGALCHSASILKRNKLKLCSYPFDWIFSNCNNIIHCIEDDFKVFLDKKYYINISGKECGHSYYNKHMFNHHNPLNNEDDYNYYVRCVDRFRNLLNFDKHKLFTMIFVNMDNIDIDHINKIFDFNSKFSKHTKNYTLLVIFHIKNKSANYHHFTYKNNIHFLELHTLSVSSGVGFNNNNDNDYLDNIIKSKYKFDIQLI